MKKVKSTLWLAVVCVLAVAAAFFFGSRWQAGRTPLVQKKETVTEAVLKEQMLGISELSTVQFFYTNMGKYENQLQLGGKDVPFTKKSFIISYDGIIKAGVELSGVSMAVDGKRVLVTLPEAKILSHEVVDDSVTVFDEKYNIFNGLNVQDVTNFQKEQKSLMEQKAMDAGILSEARSNAEKELRQLLTAAVSGERFEDGYEILFEN